MLRAMGFFLSPPASRSGVEAGLRTTCISQPPEASTGAYAKFGQAYDLSKDPRLLFNMAICMRNQHDYARMQGLLVRY